MPFVALWGLAADGQLIFAILGALDVGLAWWVLGRLPIRTWVRVAATVFFGFGTVFWYAAQIGTTWYQAHVLAVGLALAAIGVALGGGSRRRPERGRRARRRRGRGRSPRRAAAGAAAGAARRARPGRWPRASSRTAASSSPASSSGWPARRG